MKKKKYIYIYIYNYKFTKLFKFPNSDGIEPLKLLSSNLLF